MNRFLGLATEPFKVAARLTEPFPISGPMSGHGGARKYAGEERPSEVVAGKQFFGVRMLNVEARPDGSLAGTPVTGRPGSPATLSAMRFLCLNRARALPGRLRAMSFGLSFGSGRGKQCAMLFRLQRPAVFAS